MSGEAQGVLFALREKFDRTALVAPDIGALLNPAAQAGTHPFVTRSECREGDLHERALGI